MLAKGAGAKQVASLYAGLTTVPTPADVDLAWAAVDIEDLKRMLTLLRQRQARSGNTRKILAQPPVFGFSVLCPNATTLTVAGLH